MVLILMAFEIIILFKPLKYYIYSTGLAYNPGLVGWSL
nr:MAG TPA: hypothetical protein [Caudoviricetes sp.]